jgi:hypothetical protein
MKDKKYIAKNIALGIILLAIIGLASCEKYNWDPPKWDYDLNENPVRPRPIVYDDHVAPLFTKYNCTGCHGGTIPPDLSENQSESSLTRGDYLNADDPEESSVVLKITDPEHGGTWITLDLFTLLDWIYEETNLK